jgi:tetratricopeptide (TPR) repeat protein
VNANRVVIVSILLSFFVSGVVSADERDQFNQIRALLSQRKLDEADEQLAAALETHPDSSRLRSLHYSFYVYLNRADRPLDAARHAEANVDVRLGNLKRSPRTASSFAQQLGYVTSAYLKAEQADVAFEKHAEAINKVKELLEERESAELATLIVDLRARKALLLQAAGEEEKARELLDEVQSEAAMAFKKAPESTVAVLTLARVLGVRAELEPAGDAQLGATQEQLKLLAEQARQHSSDDALVTAYYDAAMLGLYSLMRTDAIAAEKELATLREFLASLPTGRGGSIASLVTSSKRTLSSIERRIGSANLPSRWKQRLG